ncbi:PAAR domain-containing protein [Paracoccus aminovorans]|uniref:PAAR domain-containing protein n=1 Tax=Paracoccus aminovorans TaxID=34004 RepID=UPI0009E70DED|nr:PAAR domain-containing protein [Paracoccus aminovorans]
MTGKSSTRLGDIASDHACHFPPTPSIEASLDVNVDGIPAVRQGDSYAPHACPTCPAPAHDRALSGGSGSVFINGKPAGRIGDAISCGGAADEGSSSVFIGD